MKITKLIEELKKVLDAEGDIEAMAFDDGIFKGIDFLNVITGTMPDGTEIKAVEISV